MRRASIVREKNIKPFIGSRRYLDAEEMKAEYLSLRNSSLKAARALENQGLYNESVYMYIQAMEKEIKSYICGKVNSANPYFSKKLRDVGHSLDKSIDFLIELLAGNDDALKNQLITQIKTGVFQNINFSKLYNDCRYPSYNLYKNRYFVLHISREDCERISQISQQLTRFIHDFDRI